MNPAIVRISGKTFIANGSMIEAEAGITLQEADQLYPPAIIVPKDQKVKTEKQDPKAKEYQVLSSKGDKSYTVSVENHSYSCTCPGYGWRRKCRHIDGIKNK